MEEQLATLLQEMRRAKSNGMHGNNLAVRCEGDIKRLMNSWWLTLFEFNEDKERSEATE